jgi:hypothetical protein
VPRSQSIPAAPVGFGPPSGFGGPNSSGGDLPLAGSTARKDAPDEHGFPLVVVVEDHAPVADAEAEVLAAREPSYVERAVLGEQTIEADENTLADGGRGGADPSRRCASSAAHRAPGLRSAGDSLPPTRAGPQWDSLGMPVLRRGQRRRGGQRTTASALVRVPSRKPSSAANGNPPGGQCLGRRTPCGSYGTNPSPARR